MGAAAFIATVSQDEVSRLYGAYHQSLGKLRIAMAFDRVETVRHLLQETRVAWNEMRGHFMQVYEIQPTEVIALCFACSIGTPFGPAISSVRQTRVEKIRSPYSVQPDLGRT